MTDPSAGPALELRDALERVLGEYAQARMRDTIGRGHQLWQVLSQLEQFLGNTDVLRRYPSVTVKWSLGRGNWAAVPWIALLDSRETTTTKRGVYCVFLFRNDMSGVYLTLNQGVTEPREQLGQSAAREFLLSRAEAVRAQVPELGESGFSLEAGIDLRVEAGLGAEYETSTIAHKLYQKGAVPETSVLLSDLDTLLAAYERYVDSQKAEVSLGPRSWIFQANPSMYDIRGSIQSLPEMTWLVRQHKDRIRAGDRAYIWEAGSSGGVVAVAKVLSDPIDIVDEAGMESFMRDATKFVGVQPRVRIRIERRIVPALSRLVINQNPALADLPILRAPQGTNFSVTSDQARALDALMGETVETDLEFDRSEAVGKLFSSIRANGYVFEPWQVAAYVTAVRTKPFVILAGVTGTGKSKLPALVASATSGEYRLIPVRPDWTDSSELLGYTDLRGQFRPGRLLDFARDAEQQRATHFVAVLDEMNLARVEHYFAEALSAIEDRHRRPDGGYESAPLLGQRLSAEAAHFAAVSLPPNLAVVGTVNMDETTHGFSKKVIDRAFTLELSDVDLGRWSAETSSPLETARWPVAAWYPRGIRLSEVKLSAAERNEIDRAVGVLGELNSFLVEAQLQVGYRSRDEIGLFILHAREIETHFVTTSGAVVDPLDLALHMKILPRVAGGSQAVRQLLLRLLGWSTAGKALEREDQAREVMSQWEDSARASALPDALYPRTAARICLMWQRMADEGFTSYWL